MVANDKLGSNKNVEQIFASSDSTPVTDELRRLMAILSTVCPKDSVITFTFDGNLHLHLDVRNFEEMTTVEALLPTVCGGIFHDVQRGMTEKHSFFHRLTAVVAR
jgi:hypothetical protein